MTLKQVEQQLKKMMDALLNCIVQKGVAHRGHNTISLNGTIQPLESALIDRSQADLTGQNVQS